MRTLILRLAFVEGILGILFIHKVINAASVLVVAQIACAVLLRILVLGSLVEGAQSLIILASLKHTIVPRRF